MRPAELQARLASELQYRADRPGGVPKGECVACSGPGAMLSRLSYSHHECGTTMPLEDFHGWLMEHGLIGALIEDDALPVPVCGLGAEIPDPPEYLVKGSVLEAEIGLFVGQGGDFKTTGALMLGGAVAGGYALFDSHVFRARQGRVLIVSNEDGLGVLLNRLEALIEGHGWDREAVLGGMYFLALEGVDLDSARWRDHVSDQVEALGIDLVIFDPYAELTTKPENDNDATKELVRYWRSLNRRGVTVLIVHHAGKKSEGRSKLDRIRGASALNAAARFVYFFEQVDMGFSVECLKLSRGERPEKFVVRADIDADPLNRASWTSARLSYLSEHRAEDLAAETFVLECLTPEPGPTSTEIRSLASSKGINPREAAEALKALQEAGRIDFDKGFRNARHWYRNEPASPSAKTTENEPASQADAGSAHPAYAGNAGSPERPCDPAPSLEGSAGSGGRVCADVDELLNAEAEA